MSTYQDYNIYERLAKIRKPVEVLQKNSKGYGYNYVDEAEILSKIKGMMNSYHVSLYPEIVPGTIVVTPHSYQKTKTGAKGNIYQENVNDVLVQSDMVWRWVCDDNPDSYIEVPWAMVGQQSDASQAFGSGLTYSSRYFLLKYFNVATTNDDPDEFRRKKKEAEEFAQKEVTDKIINDVHILVSEFLEASENVAADKKKISTVVKKYASDNQGKPSSNYYLIKNPEVAANLLNELTKKLKPEETTEVKK